MKILIDTNIILDFCLNRERYKYSEEIFKAAEDLKIIVIIGAQSIPTVYFYLQQALNHRQAIDFIRDITEKFIISDLTSEIISESLELQFNDYEEALLAHTAFRENCDFLVTNNAKDFAKSRIKAIKSDKFVKEYLKDNKKPMPHNE